MMMTTLLPSRRDFLLQAGLLSASLLTARIAGASGKPNPVILFTSGWQDVNIGDIAHTPGLIALLKKRLPQARLILWKRSRSEKVETMLKHYYPDVQIIHGKVTTGVPQSEDVKRAFGEADFFLHGSGPMVIAADYLEAWQQQTGKPFGLFGVTIQDISPSLKALLAKASLIFTRETASIQKLNEAGLSGNHIAFAPDATFALTIRNDERAKAFLTANDLKPRQFICAIPRLRVTPYYKISPDAGWSAEKIRQTDALNDKWKEADHAKLREAIIAWVRKTGHKVLVCPEMTYQVDIMDELLIDPLPADVKAKVVRHGYWLPDEATSVYAQAHTVLSFECHSPIMAAVTGTPCFYLRQPQDSIKGQMYYDLGLGDWTFEIEQTTGQQITDRLMQVTANYPAAQQNVRNALANVDKRYDQTFALLRKRGFNPLFFSSFIVHQPEKGSTTMKKSLLNVYLLTLLAVLSTASRTVARQYYVNSVSGNDANPGTELNRSWQSLAPVQAMNFQPGDTINFVCGSSWQTGLELKNSGRPGKPLVFQSIGAGEKPVFTKSGDMAKAILITGSWIIVDGFLAKDAHYAGVNIAKGANHNIIRNCELTNCGGGVMVHGQNNLITHNYAHDLSMIKNTPGGDDDYGAVAYWVFNANNEIAYNRAIRCRATSYDYGADGGFFESYTNGDSSYVHHNYAEDCNGFLEIGGGLARHIRVMNNVSVENGEWTFHLGGKFKADVQNCRIENNTIISRKGTRWNNILGLSKGTLNDKSLIFKDNLIVLGGEATERVARQDNFIHEGNTYFLLDGAQLGYVAGHDEQVNVSR